MNEHWREISVIASQGIAELLSDKLIEYGSQGTVFEEIPELPDHCKIIACYPESADIKQLINHLRQYLDNLQQLGETIGQVEIRTGVIDDRDWNAAWKRFFKPIRIGKHLVIKPSWETFEPQCDDLVIELDPGMAFGTGLHASTRLTMTLLEQYMCPGSAVLDVGVGSGILSIAAARLGAQYVLGVDTDEEAVAIARENVLKNSRGNISHKSVKEHIELRVGSIDTLEISQQFDCIVMNIRPNIIVPLVPYAATFLQTGGALIVSGILEEEGADLLHEIRNFEFIEHHHVTEEGWIAYVLSQV